MNNIKCPSCGGQKATQISDHEYRCDYCGHTFSAPTALRNTQTSQQFASQSGFQQTNQTRPNSQSPFESRTANGKNRMTAAILAIVLGIFGVHHFYLGNTGKGILYLIFFWTYIPAIIGFIEGILFLTQSDEEFASKY